MVAAGKGIVKETAVVKPKRDLFLELRGDYTQAENGDTGIPLPRIPPLRLGGALVYNTNRLSARVDYRYVFEQDRVAALETRTPGYPDLTASVQYQFATGPVGWTAYVRGTNLTNAEQRSAVSFLKDVTPMPGRGVTFGLRASF